MDAAPSVRLPPPKGPHALSAKAKIALLAKAGITMPPGSATPSQVSARQPRVESKLSLMLVQPGAVNPEANYIEFPAKGIGSPMENVGSFAGLWVKSAAPGAQILVDCAVSIEQQAGAKKKAMKVQFEDGTQMKTTLATGEHHIAWVLDSPDAKWHAFRLSSWARWSLYMCEATPL